MSKEIKTRKVRKDIKVLDKAATGTEHVKRAYVRTKEQTEETREPAAATPVEDAENQIAAGTERSVLGAVHQVRKQGGRVQRQRAKRKVSADTFKKVMALDDYLTDDVKSRMVEGSTSAFEYDGKLYSTPMFSWYMTLFCNKTLFDKAGAKLPETYDELVDAVKKLKTLDGVTPLAAGAKDGWNAAFVYQALALREVGATGVNEMLSGKKEFGDEGYKKAAQKVSDLYKLGAFGENPLEQGNDDANAAFENGKAAMRIMGSWFANNVYTDEAATINPEEVVALKIPMISDGNGESTDYCGGYVESFWVNNNTKYKEEAAKFCIYINEKMGVASYETGSGFSGWTTKADESKLNPLFIQIKDLLAEGKQGVLAWDTSLEAEPAAVHNEQVQTLFADGADINEFIDEHKAAINGK